MNAENNNHKNKQDTITFQPISNNRDMMDEVMGIRRTKDGRILGRKPRRGDQSKIINQALMKFLPIILQEKRAALVKQQTT